MAVMRHIATFRFLDTAPPITEWFISQMTAHGLAPSEQTAPDKYSYRIAGKADGNEFRLALAPDPRVSTGVILQVEPALKFWAGLRGEPDIVRQRATMAIHKLLSGSAEVGDLLWFRRTKVWKGGSEAP